MVKGGAENEPGSDGVDASALRGEFVGERPGPREHGAFGRGLGEGAGVTTFATGEGREVDDAAALGGLGEVGRGSASDAEHRF